MYNNVANKGINHYIFCCLSCGVNQPNRLSITRHCSAFIQLITFFSALDFEEGNKLRLSAVRISTFRRWAGGLEGKYCGIVASTTPSLGYWASSEMNKGGKILHRKFDMIRVPLFHHFEDFILYPG